MNAPLRIGLLAVLLAALVSLAAWYFWPSRQESAPAVPPPEVDRFQSDAAMLDRLKKASIPARPANATTAEWPQWRGPDRDGVSALRIAPQALAAAGPRRLWTVPGGPGHSSVSVSGGRAYTLFQDGEDEVVVCLDAATGEARWRHRYPAKFFETYAGTGPHGTPTVADGRVYVVGATGKFHCLDADKGTVLWRHDLVQMFGGKVPQYGVSGSPLVEGDRVVVSHGPVAAFDRKDGRVAWKSGTDRPGHSSPIIGELCGRRQLIVLTGHALHGLAPEDGTVLWSHPWATSWDLNVATPIRAGDYVFVASGYGKGCALLEASRGSDGKFSVRPVYEHNRLRSKFGTAVLSGDHLYGFDELILVCMEFRTGQVKWKQRGFGQGSLIAAGDRLIVLGEEGRLALVDASPDAYREWGAWTVSKTRCWAPPSVANGKLFLRDQESISCYDLESPQ